MKNKYNAILVKKELEKKQNEKMKEVQAEIKKCLLPQDKKRKKVTDYISRYLYKFVWLCAVCAIITILLVLLYNEFPEQYKVLYNFSMSFKNMFRRMSEVNIK